MAMAAQAVIQPTGFTTVYQPPQAQPIADIVFIHGLQGSPRGTWSISPEAGDSQKSANSKKPSDPKSKRKSLQALFGGFRRSSGASIASDQTLVGEDGGSADDGRLHWPRDLLPTQCPDCRIMVWGYDSKITKGYASANKSNLFSHAKDLLYALERERPHRRPIVFVAHSLGGLMVKEVLRRSQHSEDRKLQDIVESTISVIFMGTPHRGSAGYAGLGELTRKIASAVLRVDSNISLLRALGLDSPELELSRGSFLQQWRVYDFQVKTFQESEGPNGMNLGGINEKIVPDVSSSLDDPRERAETLKGDHRGMTKFTGPNDSNYVKVAGEIVRVLRLAGKDESASPQQTASLGQNAPIADEAYSSKEEKDALRSLAFSNMLNREQNIREAMDNTCGWLYSSAEYNSWYTGENAEVAHGLLWLKGKPGAGKSTIMRHAVQQVQLREKQNATIASFYFNARGAPLERTPLGLFRSILHQIVAQDRNVRLEFLRLYIARQKSALNPDDWTWNRLELENFLKKVFEKFNPRRTFIFIDALDECDVSTVREIVHMLAEMGTSAFRHNLDLRICLSSRHYPTISIKDCPEIMVEGANTLDIGTYIREKFKFIPESEHGAMATIESRLIEGAAGVFLWIVLVVDLLLQDFDSGQPVKMIMERLKRVPKRMEDLYAELCASLKPDEVIFSMRLFQWVLLMDAMNIQDVCLAALFATLIFSDHVSDWGYREKDTPPTDRLMRLLRNYSRGLLEYTSGSVQFIHETAREFFLTGPGLGIIEPSLADNPIGLSYLAVVMTCLGIIEFPLKWECVAKLQEHCASKILYKAREAEEQDVSTVPLLDRIGDSEAIWANLGNRHGDSLIQFLCDQRLTSCVVALLERGTDPNPRDTYSTPLLSAVGKGFPHKTTTTMVSSLISHGAELDITDHSGNTPFMVALQSGNPHLANLVRGAGADVNKVNDFGECALHVILDRKAKLHASSTLASNEGEEPKASGDSKVAAGSYQEIFEDLVVSGANLDAAAYAGTTPLHYAAQIGDVDAVSLLVHHGAPINAKDEMGTPLHSAASSVSPGAADVCQILLDNGADAKHRDKRDRTALHIAARCSTSAVVRVLLEHGGFEVSAVDVFGQTPLHKVAERVHPPTDLIQLLVDAGCSPNATDRHGRTPLQTTMDFATHLDDEGMLLLKTGQKLRSPT